ncbi:MAG: hypothetical protein H7Y02_08360 [Candidatus Obscuribacterales bacterium]|nr:hypothetical protein [Steroidobacteraceae bacterium]
MNTLRIVLIASMAALITACSSSPSKPSAPAAPAAPAVLNVAGNWIVTTESPQGAQDMKMTVVQAGKDLKGVLESPMGSIDYTGTVEANAIKFGFDFNAQGMALRIDYVGTTDGNTMKGTAVFGSFGEGTFTGKRQ